MHVVNNTNANNVCKVTKYRFWKTGLQTGMHFSLIFKMTQTSLPPDIQTGHLCLISSHIHECQTEGVMPVGKDQGFLTLLKKEEVSHKACIF
jgi:hypothetical protein